MPTNDSLLAASRERAVLDKAASDAKAAVALTLEAKTVIVEEGGAHNQREAEKDDG